jgi:hypothetical protein
MSIETGVSAQWLKDGDPQATPIPNDLNPIPPDHPSGVFTKEYFERRRADRMEDRDKLKSGATIFDTARLCAINAAAVESGNGRLAQYRISKFLDELEKEFGQCKEVFRHEMKKDGLWMAFETLFMYQKKGTVAEPQGGSFRAKRSVNHGKIEYRTEPVWVSYRELVPSFNNAYAKLAKDAKKRREKRNPHEPGIFPLLQWASAAMHIISPKRAKEVITQEDEMGLSKARRRSSKSPASPI